MDLRLLHYFVAVMEERNIGRAAARLHMSQPPLSRAVRTLERDLGVELFQRTPTGVEPTAAGHLLYEESQRLFQQVAGIRERISYLAPARSIAIGILAGSVGEHRDRLADSFRNRHPDVSIQIREADLTDPTAGLRASAVDVAITREPFDRAGISTRLLRSDPVVAVLRADDPLTDRDRIELSDIAGRTWFHFPDGTDAAWSAYWRAAGHSGPVVRTVEECLDAVLWNDAVGLSPTGHDLPDTLTTIPVVDMPNSRLVVAWRSTNSDPLIRSFVRISARIYSGTAA